MDWELGLSTGPGGYGVAISLAGEGTHLIGMFPTIARAVTSAFRAAPENLPTRVVLVHLSGIPVQELGRHIGELTAAGIDADTVEMRSDIDVLESSLATTALLIDADRDLLTGRRLRSTPFEAGTLARLVADDPARVRVFLTGHPEVRDRYHVAARDHAPQLIERPALAALALDSPRTSVMSTPRMGSSLTDSPARVWQLRMGIVIVAMVVLLVLFLA